MSDVYNAIITTAAALVIGFGLAAGVFVYAMLVYGLIGMLDHLFCQPPKDRS